MLILREHEITELLTSLTRSEALYLLSTQHDILRQYTQSRSTPASEQLIHQPERQVIVTKDGHTNLFMPTSITTHTGIKVVTVSATGIKGVINVFDPEGNVLGVLNAAAITAFRTSLAVMHLFMKFRGSVQNIVVFGAGRQAEWHIRLALLLRGDAVKQVTVINRRDARDMDKVFEDLRAKHCNVNFSVLLTTADDYEQKLKDVLGSSDVIFGCTPSTKPRFKWSDLSDKTRYISLIGSYKPTMHEVDAETLLSGGKIYVDTKEGCLSESGELIDANVKAEQLIEIGELEEDTKLGAKGNVVFKCVGMGLMDLSMAKELLRMSEQKRLGVRLNDF